MGCASSLIVGLLLDWNDKQFQFLGLTQINLWIGLILFGGMFSVLSQMAFFAYLTVHYVAMGMFRNKLLWVLLQWALIVITLFDLFYYRYSALSQQGEWLKFCWLPLLMLAFGFLIAAWKTKLTNRTALVPTLFYIIVGTSIEAVPGLRVGQTASTLFMLFPLLCCNAWQIIFLPKVLKKRSVVQQQQT